MQRQIERVVVTGMGIISALGCTVHEFWRGLLEGRTGTVALEDESFAGLSSRIGAVAAGFSVEDHFSRREARRMSRSSQFACVAADEAIAMSCVTHSAIADFSEVGVIVGSSIGGFSASDPYFRDYYVSGRKSALVIPLSMNSGPAAHVSIRAGFRGPTMTVDAACASAAHSIGYAFNLIRMGNLKIALAGGADVPFSRGVVHGWCELRALSERNDTPGEACRPFSADRDGLVLGEGAGVLVLESERSALERGAEILAEIKGYGATSDSHHITQPSQEGPARAMHKALCDAGMLPA
ncbi:MAG: beta-ketoacyl-[acyl-carrier-protein] synthase family protein, partial [Ardenticatenaceae bacterium]